MKTTRDFYEGRQAKTWLRLPWQRIEVFNTIRQLTRYCEAKRKLQTAEAKALIHSLEADVRSGYFTHREADWRRVLRTANGISIAHAFRLACLAPDLLHIAYAKELGAEWFVSFDEDQLALAKTAGLKTVRPK